MAYVSGMTRPTRWLVTAGMIMTLAAHAQVLDKQKMLDRQTFWDNRDWDWYKANIPFFECPDPDIDTTYYYRWELVTKHLTYGSPNSGYSFTEFIDRPFWSGAYGAISCPAGHQLYEVALAAATRGYARDYARYWFRTPGRSRGDYSTWLADAVWAVHLVHPRRRRSSTDLLAGPGEELRGLGEDALRRPTSACSGRPATTTGWSTTSTAARRRTSSAAPRLSADA